MQNNNVTVLEIDNEGIYSLVNNCINNPETACEYCQLAGDEMSCALFTTIIDATLKGVANHFNITWKEGE